MGLFLAFLMVASMFGFAVIGNSQQPGGITDTGLSFTIDEARNVLITDAHESAYFYYLPSDLYSVNISEGVADFFQTYGVFAVVFDQATPMASAFSSLSFDLYDLAGLQTFTVPQDNTLTCLNSSASSPLFFLEQGDTPSIALESPTCLVMTSSPDSYLRQRDRLLYDVLGLVDFPA